MKLLEIIANARRAKAQTRRGVIAQLIDIARLRLIRRGVLAETYFNFRLFDPALRFSAKARFVGPWAKDRIYRIQDPETTRLCNDKLRAYRYFEDHGLAYPRVLAATHTAVELPAMEALCSPGAIANWLAERAPYPFFVKPAVSYLGYGNKLVAARDGGQLVLGNGERIAVDSFAEQHGMPARPVMLFQELIRPHPVLQRHIGDRAATARIIVYNDRSEPEIIAAGLRIPTGTSMTDNFQSGRSGNLMTFVDLDSGRLTRVLAGLGIDWCEVETHPDTGQRLLDLEIPDWRAALDLVIRGSRALPGLKIHGWDVAFSDKGPLLVETNPRSDVNLVQLGRGRGIVDDRFLGMYPHGRL